jgi:biotin transport system substrate-specific component
VDRSRRLPARDLARVAVFAALIAVLGLPGAFMPWGLAVPITAQTLGVMLAGAVLGARRGALAVTLFLVLVLAGLPLLAGGRGGLGVLALPSAGYLLGWVPGAYVVGWLVERSLPRAPLAVGVAACLLGGVGVVYLVGVPVQAWRTDVPLPQSLVAAAVFLPGDLLKAVVAGTVAKGVHAAYPALAQERAARRAAAA